MSMNEVYPQRKKKRKKKEKKEEKKIIGGPMKFYLFVH
jgi:hypothetical protein